MDEHERTWQVISCEKSEDLLNGDGLNWTPISGRSDLDGQFGSPRVEKIWGDRDTERPHLKTIRHPEPGHIGQDRLPCEHFAWLPAETGAAELPALTHETTGR